LYSNEKEMKWDNVNITNKIIFLRELILNDIDYKRGDEYILDALITGSQNTYSGDIGFEVQSHHIAYMKRTWDSTVVNQKDDSIVNEIKNKINKF
jgi:hypothetical protein